MMIHPTCHRIFSLLQVNSVLYQGAQLSSEIQNLCELELSQARILTLSPSRASPAQAFWLEPAQASSSQLCTLWLKKALICMSLLVKFWKHAKEKEEEEEKENI